MGEYKKGDNRKHLEYRANSDGTVTFRDSCGTITERIGSETFRDLMADYLGFDPVLHCREDFDGQVDAIEAELRKRDND